MLRPIIRTTAIVLALAAGPSGLANADDYPDHPVRIIIGFTAGTCIAFQTVAKRVSVIPDFRFVTVILTFVFAILTLALTQFGFVKAKAPGRAALDNALSDFATSAE